VSDFDPKSVIVKMKSAEDTSRVPLTECPKCGFWTPVDPYCASCGVEMATIKRKPKPKATHPALIAGAMALLVVAAFVLLRPDSSSHGENSIATGLSSSGQSGSESGPGPQRPARSAKSQSSFMKAMNQLTGTSSDEASEDVAENSSMEDTGAPPMEPLGADGATTSQAVSGATSPTSAAANAMLTDANSNSGSAAGADARGAKPKSEVLVAFLWVEASKEWLQMMGATEPGFHSVPDLEARLRETQGAYNIISATRHRVSEKSEPIDVTGPERGAVRFDLTATPETSPTASGGASSLTGLAQTAARQGADGSVRAPTAAPLTIEKGEGTIMTLGKVPARPGTAASTGAEIVVLILPRWVDDRNP